MFGEDFKQRVRLESIAQFILTGDELTEKGWADRKQHGSLEEHLEQLHDDLMQRLKDIRVLILAEQWDELSENKAGIRFEDIINPVLGTANNLQQLYFRAGLFAGLEIAAQLRSF